jgi:uncharacterized Rmd1/YagE family protein
MIVSKIIWLFPIRILCWCDSNKFKLESLFKILKKKKKKKFSKLKSDPLNSNENFFFFFV